MTQTLRSTYVSIMRAARWLMRRLGALDWLEARQTRIARWLRSLLAIYDIDDLVHLDTPWWTYDAIAAVDGFLSKTPNARVFEWGSGASTVWLAKRAGEVISVEHDVDWAKIVAPRVAGFGHVRLMRVPSQEHGQIGSAKVGFEGQFFDEYVAAIRATSGSFDLIVIDGRAREACLEVALARLAPGGKILFDDFKRRRYQEATARAGLTVERLDGLAACLPLPDSTVLITPPTASGAAV